MSDVIALGLAALVALFVLLLVVWDTLTRNRRASVRPRDAVAFQDAQREERRRQLARLSTPAPKGLSEDSRREHLQMIAKAGERKR